jgi:HlyD family secretion protein
MKKLLIGIVAIALLITGCAQSSKPTATPTATAKKAAASGASAQGYVTPLRHADLAFRTGGRVMQVLVAEGDPVKASQPLVKLQETELKAALMQAQADLKSLQNGARPEEIAATQANLDTAKSQLEVAQAELSRLQNGALAAQLAAAQADAARAAAELKVAQDSYDALVLGPGHGIATDMNNPSRGLGAYEEQRRAELAATKAAYTAAQKRLAEARASVGDSLRATQANVGIAAAQRDAAQARLNLLKAGATPEQIAIAQARVAQAQAALDEATLVAPFEGTIAELDVHLGEIAAPGVRVASIADLTQWQVETDDLSEVDIVGVQPGAEASVTVDALPGVTLHGKVTSITPRSAVKRGDVTYTVKVAITDPDPRLKWGMTSFVDIRK